MILRHEKFRMVDEDKNNEFFIEVNWNPKDPKSNECKLVKFTFPDGSSSTIKREHLHSILFAIGSEDEQRKLIPQVLYKVKTLEGNFTVKATKDIAKGEQVVFPYKLDVPMDREEVIRDLNKVKRRA